MNLRDTQNRKHNTYQPLWKESRQVKEIIIIWQNHNFSIIEGATKCNILLVLPIGKRFHIGVGLNVLFELDPMCEWDFKFYVCI
jgi:hypothetical protein